MPKLNNRFVESLTTEGRDQIVIYNEVNGFELRVMPSGRKSYFV